MRISTAEDLHAMPADESKNSALVQLVAMRDEASAACSKAKKEVEKARERVKQAEIAVATLNVAIARISGGSEVPKSQKDAILDAINDCGDQALTSQQILDKLAESGFAVNAANPQASVHVAADRLAEAGLIEIVHSGSGKLFKRKAS